MGGTVSLKNDAQKGCHKEKDGVLYIIHVHDSVLAKVAFSIDNHSLAAEPALPSHIKSL